MVTALLTMLGLLAMAPERPVVEAKLDPAMPALSALGVPTLAESVPDADRMDMELRLEPEKPFRWVVAPGEALTVRLRAPAASGARVVLTAWDWERRPVWRHETAAPAEVDVRFRSDGRGAYLLTLDALDARGRCRARLARSFAVCPPNDTHRGKWRESGFRVGSCSFPGRQHWRNDYGAAAPAGMTEQQARELDADLAARMGIDLLRIDLPIEWPSEDAPIGFERADACVETLVRRGFQLDLQITPAPDWAVLPAYADRKDPLWRYPHREGPVRRIAAEVARRYGKHAAFLEVYNEPDNPDFWRGTPEEYGDYLRWNVEELRKAAPGVPIANGGYTLIDPEAMGRIARAAASLVDRVAYHFHGPLARLPDTFAAVRAATAAAGGPASPKWLNTEMGYAAWRLDVERDQAATAVQKLLWCWSRGHEAALLYCTREVGGPRLRLPDADWGFVDHTFCPRFAYAAVAAFIDRLAGARFEKTLLESWHANAYLFRTAAGRTVAVFVPEDRETEVVIASDARAARIVDPMGNASPAQDPRRVALRAGYCPRYVELDGATAVSVETAR